MKSPFKIREKVRERYAAIASEADRGARCCGGGSTCGSTGGAKSSADISLGLGYTADDLAAVPEGANLGLGCGNPSAIASLRRGETVLDLGSGGGFDCFLAARQVGPEGRVIGVDMTPDMLEKARGNAERGGYGHVEFRLGEIEHLPVADGCVDVVISNCVINLSPEKGPVYREAFRVLRPGGRLAVSDVVARMAFPDELAEDMQAYGGCLSGASQREDIRRMLEEAGFKQVEITPKNEIDAYIKEWVPGRDASDYIYSANVTAVKP